MTTLGSARSWLTTGGRGGVPRRRREPSADTADAAELVAGLCREAARRLPPAAAAPIARLAEELEEPQLRVAVVGRVSSGKSTLVNALVGRRIAPTDAGECTRVVTCYRHGPTVEATGYLRDGGTVGIAASAGEELRLDLPVRADLLSHVEVRVPAEPLRDITLLDSPGISSSDGDVSAQTHDLVSHRWSAAPTPDAVAFVLTQNLREDESRLLDEIDGANTLLPASVNTVGVLTKADLVGGGGPDAWDAAARLASSMAVEHVTRFSAVVPVIGLLAEAGSCAGLTERGASALAALAAGWNPDDRALALLSPEFFLAQPGPVDTASRAQLLAVLGLAGVRRLLGCIDEGVTRATALNAACRRMSGVDDLDTALVECFRERADALKASRALSAVMRAAHGAVGRSLSPRQRDWLRNRAEEVRYDPRTHRILELEVLHRVLAAQVTLPRELRDDVLFVVQRGGRRSRGLGAAEWQLFESRAASAGQRAVARVMVRGYQLSAEGPGR